jgi:hypothetical protein
MARRWPPPSTATRQCDPQLHLVETEAAETLFEMRNPRPVAFVKQANNANGPQQVNNGVPSAESPSHAGLQTNQSNELLGLNHEQRLDTGTTGAAGGVHSRLEPVGVRSTGPRLSGARRSVR